MIDLDCSEDQIVDLWIAPVKVGIEKVGQTERYMNRPTRKKKKKEERGVP